MTADSPTAIMEAEFEAMRKRMDDLSARMAKLEDGIADPMIDEYLKHAGGEVARELAKQVLAGRADPLNPISSAKDPHEHEPWHPTIKDAALAGVDKPGAPPMTRYCKVCNRPIQLTEAGGYAIFNPLYENWSLPAHEHEPGRIGRFMLPRDGKCEVTYCRHCNEPIEKVEAGGHSDAVWRLVKPWSADAGEIPAIG